VFSKIKHTALPLFLVPLPVFVLSIGSLSTRREEKEREEREERMEVRRNTSVYVLCQLLG